MEIMDMVNDFAKKVGDKANELVEYGKLSAKLHTDNEEVEELQRQLGEICFGKYRAGDELDPEIEEICVRIERLKRNIAETRRSINKMKTSPADTVDMAAMGYCPYCGAELVKDAKFCPSCGKAVR